MSLVRPTPETVETHTAILPPGTEAAPVDPRVQRLGEIRDRIDEIDQKVVALINERAGLGLAADEIKEELGQPVLNASREQEVINNVVTTNEGPMEGSFFAAMFMEGMRRIRELQHAARERRAASKRLE